MASLFCTLDSPRIAEIVRSANRFVCYAGPGIQLEVAEAVVEVSRRIGPQMITISLDVDERVMRMGFGDIAAVKLLREAKIIVNDAPAIRTALILTDVEGFQFTPTALYLEAEPRGRDAPNALRLSEDQRREVLAHLSPVAKAFAKAQAPNASERERIDAIRPDIVSRPVQPAKFEQVEKSLNEAPPVKFDVARQVRVFNAYLQYVELKLSGAAIQRHRLTIPPSILQLGTNEQLEGRLRTTFDLIAKDDKLSSKRLETQLNDIRKNFTPSLGKDHGRVVLKNAKPHLEQRLAAFKTALEEHQKKVADDLQAHLNASREQIIAYYLPNAMENPPDVLLGQLLTGSSPSEDDVRNWLNGELDRVFPTAEELHAKMQVDVQFKDVTFETLNQQNFLAAVKNAFPKINWDKAYQEFQAAREGADHR